MIDRRAIVTVALLIGIAAAQMGAPLYGAIFNNPLLCIPTSEHAPSCNVTGGYFEFDFVPSVVATPPTADMFFAYTLMSATRVGVSRFYFDGSFDMLVADFSDVMSQLQYAISVSYWPAENALLVTGCDQKLKGTMSIFAYFLSNNTRTLLSSISLDDFVSSYQQSSGYAFDTVNNVLWFEVQCYPGPCTDSLLSGEIWGYSVVDRKIVFQQINYASATPVWSETHQSMFGYGYNASSYQNQVVVFNSQGLAVNNTLFNGLKAFGSCTRNDYKGVMYCYAKIEMESIDYYMLGIDLLSGLAISSVVSSCPLVDAEYCPSVLVLSS